MKAFIRTEALAGDTFEEDLFERKETAESLIGLIEGLDQPISIALDGSWGSGKSVFLKKFSDLADERLRVVSFDAYSVDFYESAFLALSSEINKSFRDSQAKSKRFRVEAGKVAGMIARASGRIAIRAATAGIIEQTDIEAATEEAFKSAGEAVDRAYADALKRVEAEGDIRKGFKEALEALVLSEHSGDAGHGKLVIIVDELDRCNPIFALSLIESAKHFFNIDGVYFLFALNKAEFLKVVEGAYGQGFNSQTYVEKFFDVTISLHPIESGSASDRERYARFLWENMGFDSDFSTEYYDASGLLLWVSEANDLPFRSMERLFSEYALMLLRAGKNSPQHDQILVPLAFMASHKRELISKIMDGKTNGHDIVLNVLEGNRKVATGSAIKEIGKDVRNLWSVMIMPTEELSKIRPNTDQSRALVQLNGRHPLPGLENLRSYISTFAN